MQCIVKAKELHGTDKDLLETRELIKILSGEKIHMKHLHLHLTYDV